MTKTVLPLTLTLASLLPAQVIPLDPSQWRLAYFSGKLGSVTAIPGGIAFDFPNKGNAFLDYAYWQAPYLTPLALSGTLSVTFQILTTGAPVFNYDSEKTNTCIASATVRPYLQSSTVQPNGLNRWWSNPIAYVLAPGMVTLTVPLTPDQWTSTYGQRGSDYLAEFAQSLQTVEITGLSFGGGCFFGHGINVTGGTAQFQLLAYSLF